MDTTDNIIRIEPKRRDKGPIRSYFDDAGRLLLEPSRFFRTRFASFSLSEAMCFGLVGIWLSSLISFFWDSMNSVLFRQLVSEWVRKIVPENTPFLEASRESYVMQAGWVLLAPFWGALKLLFSGLLLFFFGKLLISGKKEGHENVGVQNAMKIAALASVGTWFSVVPLFGDLLSMVAVIILTVIGVREVYGISTRRAAAVVLAPQALFFLLLFFAVIFIFIALLATPWDEIMRALMGGGPAFPFNSGP